MRKITVAFIALLCAFGIQDLQADAIEFEHGTWEQVLQKAQKEDKLIFVDCMTSWCGPCKWMAANVMTVPEVASFYNENFINVKLDMEKGDGKVLAKEFGISTFPTLAFFNGAAEMIWRVPGARPAEEFIALGQKVLDGVEPLQKTYDTFNSGEYDRAFLYDYLVLANETGANANDALEKWAEGMSPEDLAKEKEFDIFMRFFWRTDTEFFAEFEKNLEVYKEKNDAEKVEEKYYRCLLGAISQAIYKNEQGELETVIAKIGDGGGEMVQASIVSQLLYNQAKNFSKEACYELLVENLKNGVDVGPTDLNQYAWQIYEENDDPKWIKEALNWVELAVEDVDNLGMKSAIIDTWGMLLYKSGDNSGAIKKLEESIEMGEEVGEDVQSSVEALEKIRKE